MLFILYINDLPLYLETPCELFADDSSVHCNHVCQSKLTTTLQKNINTLLHWTELNHMCLNAQKTKSMWITTRQKKQHLSTQSSISIAGETIEVVNSHRVLGIVIDSHLSWSEHIAYICKRISQRVFQLSKLKHFLNLNARKLFFHAHIQSLVDYVSTIWDSVSTSTLQPLMRLHKRALKLVLLKSSTLTPNDYKTLDILPLNLRLFYNKGLLMHKVMNGAAPPAITNSFQINENRHRHKITVPFPRVDIFKTSFLYSGGTLWNNLPQHLKQIHSHTKFSNSLRKYLLEKVGFHTCNTNKRPLS